MAVGKGITLIIVVFQRSATYIRIEALTVAVPYMVLHLHDSVWFLLFGEGNILHSNYQKRYSDC